MNVLQVVLLSLEIGAHGLSLGGFQADGLAFKGLKHGRRRGVTGGLAGVERDGV